jgi:nucleoside recognition membrane protein YjiH
MFSGCEIMESRKTYSSLLVLLLSADAVFILLYILHLFTQYASHIVFSLEQDGGYGDVFQYVKWYWITIIMLWMFVKTRHIAFCFWGILFGYLLFDDSCQFHERVGAQIAQFFDLAPAFYLKPQDCGQLMVCLFAGLMFFTLIGGAFLFSTNEVKKVSKRLVLFLGIIAFFGVLFDALHSMVYLLPIGSFIGVLEDGGEMLAASITCWYVYIVFENDGREPFSDKLYLTDVSLKVYLNKTHR